MKKASDIDISKVDTSSPEFANALKLLQYTRQSVFLTGKAGTGKSTFLHYLTQTTRKRHVVLAPTGIAAVNAGGQTIHSFFKLPFKPMMPDDPDLSSARRLRERMKYSSTFVKLLKSLELIIIDEVSMVRADTIDMIDTLLRVYCGNHRQPFGGKQLLLVGDVFQLEPVITGDMRDVLSFYYRSGSFFFNARVFSELAIVPIELTKVYRQTDLDFIHLLDRIRMGQPLPQDIAQLNSRIISAEEADNAKDFTMTIATRRDIVDRINETRLARLRTPVREYAGKVSGDFPDSSLPTDKLLVLKEGAQVVFVKNDMERRWVNGTLGRICELSADEMKIQLEDGTKHSVEREVWHNVRYEYDEEKHKVNEVELGSFTQFPVKLAWALTIHKSQGLTFDRVVIDVGPGAFSGGQSYVALSRCRSLEGIRLRSTINPRDIFVNPRVTEFSRQFNNELLMTLALENARADDCYHRAAKAYDRGEYREAASLFAEAVTARNYLDRPEAVRLLSMKLSALGALRHRIALLEQEKAEADRRFLQLATEYVSMGEDCREQGWDLDAAVANYDKAISLAPAYSLAWIGKGLALAQMSDLDGAMDALLQAARLDTADHRALYEAGRLMINSGDIVRGIDLLLQALDRNDRVAETHLALADGYEAMGDEASAAAHRKAARKIKKLKK